MKYMGSKSRIAKYIVPIIQGYIDKYGYRTYYEPFVGGANIIDKIKCDKKIGGDINRYLIALLIRSRNSLPLIDKVSKDLYDQARSSFNNGDTSAFEDWEIGCIGFLASYNGRFFDGGFAKAGYEKTKSGKRYRDYYQEAKNNLINQMNSGISIQSTMFVAKDFKDWKPENALIYCDPPYANTKQYGINREFNHYDFWNIARKWSTENNNKVIVSEQTAPNDFKCIWEQEVSRSIKACDKSTAVERLFIYSKPKRFIFRRVTTKEHRNIKILKDL